MPANDFNVGRDISLAIVGPTGDLDVSLVTGWMNRQDTNDVRVKGLDGIVRHLIIPDGWSGTLEIERQNPVLDAYFSQFEEDFYGGVNQQTLTITETIEEPDGSVSQYRFEGVQLKLEDAGEWRGDTSVKARVAMLASRKKRI